MSPVLIGIILWFHEEVGHRWVMRGMLAVYLGPILELALQGFPEDGIEGFVLGCGEVDPAQGEGDHQLEPLQLIALGCGQV